MFGLLLFGAVCSGIGYYMAPEKVVEKTKTVTVVKTVEVVKEVRDVDRDVETKTRIKENPDGSRETIVTERDRSREVVRRDTETERDETKTEAKERVVSRSKKAWLATAGVGAKLNELDSQIFIGAIHRRIIGEVYLGVWATSTGEVGVGATIRF